MGPKCPIGKTEKPGGSLPQAANTSIQVPRRGFEGGLGMLALLGHFHATCKLLSQADWEE